MSSSKYIDNRFFVLLIDSHTISDRHSSILLHSTSILQPYFNYSPKKKIPILKNIWLFPRLAGLFEPFSL